MKTFNEEFIWVILALFGGLARYLDTYLKGSEIFSIGRMIATIIVCGFSGFMVAELMLLLYPNWALWSAGIGGYAGVEALNFLFTFWKSKINVIQQASNDDDKKDKH
jgi:hypothetical protein